VATPTDRESLERERRSRTRQCRAARIQRFTERQREKHEWINLAEIAEWCSEEDHSILQNEDKRAAAFDRLSSDLLAGEFEENGHSQVLYLHLESRKTRMTREWLKDAIDHSWGGDRGKSQYLAHCWIRRLLFDRWCARHNLPASPERFQPRKSYPSSGKARSNALAPIPKSGRGAKTRGIETAIAQIWPQGIPDGLSGKDRDCQIGKWLQHNGCSVPRNVSRAVQRVLKAQGSR
jgi:hypothetical protein